MAIPILERMNPEVQPAEEEQEQGQQGHQGWQGARQRQFGGVQQQGQEPIQHEQGQQAIPLLGRFRIAGQFSYEVDFPIFLALIIVLSGLSLL